MRKKIKYKKLINIKKLFKTKRLIETEYKEASDELFSILITEVKNGDTNKINDIKSLIIEWILINKIGNKIGDYIMSMDKAWKVEQFVCNDKSNKKFIKEQKKLNKLLDKIHRTSKELDRYYEKLNASNFDVTKQLSKDFEIAFESLLDHYYSNERISLLESVKFIKKESKLIRKNNKAQRDVK